MKNLFLGLVLLVSIKPIYGQVGNENISHKDSIELNKAWKRFQRELYLKDINALKLLSCKKVSGHCIFEPVSVNCQPYSPPDKLLALFFKDMFPQNRAIILINKYKIVVYSSIKDKAMKIKYPAQFQIWFTNNSEPGYQFAFIFEKMKGRFKFSGLDSIP